MCVCVCLRSCLLLLCFPFVCVMGMIVLCCCCCFPGGVVVFCMGLFRFVVCVCGLNVCVFDVLFCLQVVACVFSCVMCMLVNCCFLGEL